MALALVLVSVLDAQSELASVLMSAEALDMVLGTVLGAVLDVLSALAAPASVQG
jgi:hypothetical protein